MLKYIGNRKHIFYYKESKPLINFVHEKEREYLDCIRVIIHNGYVLNPIDIIDIIRFIQFYEVFAEEEENSKKVIALVIESMDLIFGEDSHNTHKEMISKIVDEAKNVFNEELMRMNSC